MSGVNLARVGAILTRHLGSVRNGLSLMDETTGELHSMRAETAGAADGALPIFLAAADAVCLEATGQPIGLELEPDPDSFLGVKVAAIRRGSFTTVMLCLIEAVARAVEKDILIVNDLSKVAALSRQHAAQSAA